MSARLVICIIVCDTVAGLVRDILYCMYRIIYVTSIVRTHHNKHTRNNVLIFRIGNEDRGRIGHEDGKKYVELI